MVQKLWCAAAMWAELLERERGEDYRAEHARPEPPVNVSVTRWKPVRLWAIATGEHPHDR